MWAVGTWRLIQVLAAVASQLRSLIDVSPFPFDISFVGFSRFQMALVMQLACVMLGFVMCLCWNKTVSNTRSGLIFLTLQICALYFSGELWRYHP